MVDGGWLIGDGAFQISDRFGILALVVEVILFVDLVGPLRGFKEAGQQ